MIPQPLHRPFVGIELIRQDYGKVQGILPTPTYLFPASTYDQSRLILIYLIDGAITSSAQYYWLGSIQLGIEAYLPVWYERVEEFYIRDETQESGLIYTLGELSSLFNAPKIHYPKPFYPASCKELYQRLIWYAKRLIHQGIYTHAALTAAALQMNKPLRSPCTRKELHRKTAAAHLYTMEHRDTYPIRLSSNNLQRNRSQAAQRTAQTKRTHTQKRIDDLLRTHDYTKPNGTINKTKLANDLGINRRTLDKYF